MKVRMLYEISGTRDGKPWPAKGEVLEVEDADEAAQLLGNKMAEPYRDEPEKAAAHEAPETATK